MTPRSIGTGIGLVLLLVNGPYAGPVFAADPPVYVIEDLGSLAGDTEGRAINASGTVAGVSSLPDGTKAAFVALDGSGPQELPTLGGVSAQAFGVNDAGFVSGVSDTPDGSSHAFRAAPGAMPVDLGTLGGANSAAFGIAANGAVAGYSSTGSEIHAFRYTDGGGMQDLGTLGGGTSFAWATNVAGVVVGQSYTSDGHPHGFVYAGGAMNDVGTFGGSASNATAVNASGVVVGAATNAAGRYHAFRLAPGGTLADLGTLGGNWSGAEGVNGPGDIVGWSQIATGAFHASMWSASGAFIDLNTLVDPASGWVLTTAYAINDKGQMTGYGFLNGQQRAFRLSPAVPVDSTPPVVSSVSATPAVLDPPNHRLVTVAVTVRATDDSGEAPVCTLTDVRSNEPDNGLGDGDTAGDIVRTGPLSLQLRAERSASGSGRVYTLDVLCTDAAGNASPGSTQVTVVKAGSGGGDTAKKPKTR